MRRTRTVYAINRYYSPDTGRFTTHDPLTELDRPDRMNQPQGLNLYPYVMGAPTRYTDPDGRDWTWNSSNGDFEWRADKNQSPTKGYVPVEMGQSFDEMWDWTGDYASLNGLGAICVNPDLHSPAAFDRILPPPPPDPLADGPDAEPDIILEGATIAIDQPEIDPNEEFVWALPGAIAGSFWDANVAIYTYPVRVVEGLTHVPGAVQGWSDRQATLNEQAIALMQRGDYGEAARLGLRNAWDNSTIATGLPSTSTIADPETYLRQARDPQFFIDKTYEVVGAIAGGGASGRAGSLVGKLDDAAILADDAGNYVYRGLAKGEDISDGLVARMPDAGDSPISHVAGKRDSQWISTTKSRSIAFEEFGEHGVVRIDLSKVGGQIVDVSGGFPSMPGMISNWARRFQEVLIKNRVPLEAIERLR